MFTVLPEGQIAKLGQHYVILNCAANGNPKPHLTWFFNIKKILLSDRTFIYHNGSIKIEHILESDAGSYSCQAENIHGKIKSTVELEIYSK